MYSVYKDEELHSNWGDLVDAVNQAQSLWVDTGNVIVVDESGELYWDNGDWTQEGFDAL